MARLHPEIIEFDYIADLLQQMDVFSSPSELHGLLCGQMSKGKVFDEQNWLDSAAAFLERVGIEESNIKEMLLELYASTLDQLSGSGFDIHLVLPDDESELSLRIESLGRWCLGFLAGFGESRGGRLSDDLSESLNDLQEITDIQSDDSGPSEDSEHDLVQVEEYVRMVVILAYSEMNAGNRNNKNNSESSLPFH